MTVTRALVVGIGYICLLMATPAEAGQTTSSARPSATAEKRFVWTLIGGGLGVGGGLVSGLALFEDAINSDRKVWTMTAVGAIGGGLIGNLSSRSGGGEAAVDATDPLWNGMAIGAAAGAVVGLWHVPARHCDVRTNPECPNVLRIGVGIPAIASGAALGAWVDRLRGQRREGQSSTTKRSRSFVIPVVASGAVGVVYTRSFR